MNDIRHNWTTEEVAALYDLPFMELIFQAQTAHRKHFPPNKMQFASLLNIKTGACPEDCKYCPQAGVYNTGLKKEKLMCIEDVLAEAKDAKERGAQRFCMGAAWRSPPKKDLPKVAEMIKEIKALGLETCVTLGMLDTEDTQLLKEAGLDFYNHNLDTSPEYYKKIISTRTYQERLDTLENVRNAGMKVCCGGIIGMGETREDRIGLLLNLANLPEHPQSVPINNLIPIPGTPLAQSEKIDSFEFVRTIAIAKIMMPASFIRLSAGRYDMSYELQTLCFLAGANSIFLGDTLLTAANARLDRDQELMSILGISSI
jgi:biotin synthase